MNVDLEWWLTVTALLAALAPLAYATDRISKRRKRDGR